MLKQGDDKGEGEEKKKSSSMTLSRYQLLTDLGFSWEMRPGLDRPRASWQQRYDELKDFHQQHGHFLVPAADNPALNGWCQEQKQRLKYLDKNRGKDVTKRMGPDRVKSLADIGFTKDVDLADAHIKYKAKPDSDEHNSSGAEEEVGEGGAPNSEDKKPAAVATTVAATRTASKTTDADDTEAASNIHSDEKVRRQKEEGNKRAADSAAYGAAAEKKNPDEMKAEDAEQVASV